MNTREFADMYAQTIVYGLFIGRYNDTTPDSFDKYEAIRFLQEESELLKQFFLHIAGTGRKHPTLEGLSISYAHFIKSAIFLHYWHMMSRKTQLFIL